MARLRLGDAEVAGIPGQQPHGGEFRSADGKGAKAKGKALVEVSGGITLERIAKLAAAGVDVISSGALTHSAPSADIALDLERLG